MLGEGKSRIRAEQYQRLATAMVRNSIYHATSAPRFHDVCERTLMRPKGILAPSWKVHPRIVVVVGAGASFSACGLPLGAGAAKFLGDSVRERFGRDLVDAEIERLRLQHNLDDADFETILLALSKFDRSFVLEKLRAVFARRHHPWLGYELLAHYLKHRYIDAIINFNFDEILDQAVSDEVGDGDYYHVVLDGDCPTATSSWYDDDKRKFRLPLYVKPHGSAGQPSSMRFTRESYTAIPEGITALLQKLFFHDRPTRVVVLGHAMQSIEFNHILSTAVTRGANLSFFLMENKKNITDSIVKNTRTRPERPTKKLVQIDYVLLNVWKIIENSFKKNVKGTASQRDKGSGPRGIMRHQLIADLFAYRRIENWEKSDTPEDDSERAVRLRKYFRSRTYVEIILAVAKAKGYASLDDLASARVGRYFKLYRNWAAPGHTELNSIGDACVQLDLDHKGYGGPMVTPRLVGKRHRAKTTVIVPRSEFEVYARKAAAKVLDLIEGGTARVKAADFAQVLMKMYDGEEVEVSLNRGTDRTLLLEGAVALPTLSALKLRTDEIMREHDWDAIVCTAKTGQWLFDYSDVIRQRKRKLALVVADTTFASNLRSRLAQSLKPGIRWLPWWLQNRHVTVYLKDNEPRLAFSFERRLRTATITPLELCGKDVHAAWDTFVAYWVRADRFKHGLSDDYIPDTVIELTRKSLLRKLAPPRKTRRKRTA